MYSSVMRSQQTGVKSADLIWLHRALSSERKPDEKALNMIPEAGARWSPLGTAVVITQNNRKDDKQRGCSSSIGPAGLSSEPPKICLNSINGLQIRTGVGSPSTHPFR